MPEEPFALVRPVRRDRIGRELWGRNTAKAGGEHEKEGFARSPEASGAGAGTRAYTENAAAFRAKTLGLCKTLLTQSFNHPLIPST